MTSVVRQNHATGRGPNRRHPAGLEVVVWIDRDGYASTLFRPADLDGIEQAVSEHNGLSHRINSGATVRAGRRTVEFGLQGSLPAGPRRHGGTEPRPRR
jgi:hypothetical protein